MVHRVTSLNKNIKIPAIAPKAPTLLSFIASIFLFGSVQLIPSKVSIRPSMCNPPVIKTHVNKTRRAENMKGILYTVRMLEKTKRKEPKIKPIKVKYGAILPQSSGFALGNGGAGSLVRNNQA